VFDIGFLELLLIFVVALLVLGPEKLPYVARTIGLWIGKIKRSIAGVQMEVERELRFEEMRQEAEARAKQLEKEMALPELSIDPSHPNGSQDFEPLPREANPSDASAQTALDTANNSEQEADTKSQASKLQSNPQDPVAQGRSDAS
jgi:sec-independent protein translocase protein TatB